MMCRLFTCQVSSQVLQHADVAFFLGIIDTQQRIKAMGMQLLAAQLIAEGGSHILPAHKVTETRTHVKQG
jgi:hypothetical protein